MNTTSLRFGMIQYTTATEVANEFPSLPPEVEEGNIEYKLKLVCPTESRFEHLVTQMKWRLKEGNGEAIYEIGVEDNGLMTGLLKEDLDASMKTLKEMANRLDAEIIVICERTIENVGQPSKFAVEALVRKIPDCQEFIEIKVACLGNADAGKSTLLGVLCYGDLDNGRGRARLNVFRHLHEIQSGRTSSISHEILGFDRKGQALSCNISSLEEICSLATKLITFLDLAGHHKYIKTTIFGLTGCSPEVVLLVIDANRGIVGTTKEHLGLAVALKIPFLIVVNKIDLCDQCVISKTVNQLEKILKSTGLKKIPMIINDQDDVLSAASNFSSQQIAPIFQVSSVTGKNLDLLRSFFNVLPSLKTRIQQDELLQQSAEFQIDEVFTVLNVGSVLAGTLRSGTIRENDKMIIGPTDDGSFFPAVVASIHRNRSPCRLIQAGYNACISLADLPNGFICRRGQVLLEYKESPPVTCMQFEVDFFLLFHNTKISKKFQASLHVANVVQTAVIKRMDKDFLLTGQRANVLFNFISRPEYIRKGDRVLLRQGQTKGIGEIKSIYPYIKESKNSNSDSE
uniref:GTP-binding protein 2 n=1 Tax=Hydra vulgaris TaxID=6087 RepID=T2M6D6_HYDVU